MKGKQELCMLARREQWLPAATAQTCIYKETCMSTYVQVSDRVRCFDREEGKKGKQILKKEEQRRL